MSVPNITGSEAAGKTHNIASGRATLASNSHNITRSEAAGNSSPELTHSHIDFESREKSEIEVGMLQMQILWILSRKSTHGYDLMKSLTALRGASMTQGTMYPTLQRLLELGLVKKEDVDRRIIYHLTEKGRKTMNESCLDFVKTFYGIFHDFACNRCDHHKVHAKA